VVWPTPENRPHLVPFVKERLAKLFQDERITEKIQILDLTTRDSNQPRSPQGFIPGNSTNSDPYVGITHTKDLAPRYFVVGYDDEVQGQIPLSLLCQVPTRNELLLLVKHYAEEALDHEYFSFLYATYGSD